MRGGKRSVPPLSAFFHEKESLAKKADCRAAPRSRLDRFIFCTAVCGKPGFCKEQAKEHTMYVTARATSARRGIDHNAKPKNAFEKSLAKPKWSNIRRVFLFDALSGMFNARVRGGCRRARSPHANELCEHLHASKADATNVARMSGGRAISRERPERVPTALAPGAQAQ